MAELVLFNQLDYALGIALLHPTHEMLYVRLKEPDP